MTKRTATKAARQAVTKSREPVALTSRVPQPVVETKILVKGGNVAITNITSSALPNGTGVALFGLGDDQRAYAWNFEHGVWVPNWQT